MAKKCFWLTGAPQPLNQPLQLRNCPISSECRFVHFQHFFVINRGHGICCTTLFSSQKSVFRSATEDERTPNSLYNKHDIIFKRFPPSHNLLFGVELYHSVPNIVSVCILICYTNCPYISGQEPQKIAGAPLGLPQHVSSVVSACSL